VAGDEVFPLVYVRVCVNVDSLRIGYEGEVELAPRIQKLVAAGYLQILGHVWVPELPVSPTLPAQPGPGDVAVGDGIPSGPVANPVRTRAPRKAVDGGAAGTDPA
jgi:hypothetical protein